MTYRFFTAWLLDLWSIFHEIIKLIVMKYNLCLLFMFVKTKVSWEHSSVVEHSTANREVTGSNLVVPLVSKRFSLKVHLSDFGNWYFYNALILKLNWRFYKYLFFMTNLYFLHDAVLCYLLINLSGRWISAIKEKFWKFKLENFIFPNQKSFGKATFPFSAYILYGKQRVCRNNWVYKGSLAVLIFNIELGTPLLSTSPIFH